MRGYTGVYSGDYWGLLGDEQGISRGLQGGRKLVGRQEI